MIGVQADTTAIVGRRKQRHRTIDPARRFGRGNRSGQKQPRQQKDEDGP